MQREDLDGLAIFPLRKVVLFPGTCLPLHVFEPRYRTLVEDVLRDDAPIAMTMIAGEEGGPEPPDVRDVAGVGRVFNHQRLEDGRFLLTLEGIGRIRIDEEIASHHPYRLVRATELRDLPNDEETCRELAETVRNLALSLQTRTPRVSTLLVDKLERIDDPSHTSNVLCDMLFDAPHIRQKLLEERKPEERLAAVISRLSDILMEHAPSRDGRELN